MSSFTVNSERFWERLWRSSGIIFGIFFVVAYLFYGLHMVFSRVLLARRSPSTTPQAPEPPAAAPAP
jgi:hypothetical protein